MKSNILLSIALIFFVTPLIVSAQVMNTGFGESGIYLMASTTKSKSQIEFEYESIEGSPYLFSDFRLCNIYLKNGSDYKDIPVRLNIFNNSLEFQRSGTYYVFEEAEGIDKIVFANGEKITFIENKNKEIEGFYRIEEDGKYKLLISLDVNFREGKSASNSYSEDVSPQFIRMKDRLYIQPPDGSLVYLKNKKSFIKAFEVNHKEFVNYAKTNKLNLSKQEDLIKMVAYMNASKK